MRCIRFKASHPFRLSSSAASACMQPQTVLVCRAVKEFAENYIKSGKKLHCLINNAGTALPPHSITKDGFEVQEAKLSVLSWCSIKSCMLCHVKGSLPNHAPKSVYASRRSCRQFPCVYPSGDAGFQLLWASVPDQFAD